MMVCLLGMCFMYEEQFRARLIELRTKAGVSARDMSLSLGQSESYINRVENGKMMPSMTVFFYICDYFHITPAEFFQSDSFSADILRATQKLSRLPHDKLLHILSVIMDL